MIRSLLTAFLLSLSLDMAAAEGALVDLELVLAVDASASVDDEEFALQVSGIAAAFRDPDVVQAIGSGPAGRIAVNLMVWAEAAHPKDFTGWYVLAGEADARAFAGVIEAFPRRITGGTGIGEAVAHAIRSLDGNGIEAPRRLVDVSGDGEETAPRDFAVMLPGARAMAIARDVTVNGLAILNEVPDLDRYYRDTLQIGPGSFVMSAATYADLAEAMRRKLLREIDPRPQLSWRGLR